MGISRNTHFPNLSPDSWWGRFAIARRPLGSIARSYLQRPFSKRGTFRVCFFYTSNRIAFSEVYPFIHYSRELLSDWGVQSRFFPVERLLDPQGNQIPAADLYFAQPWFTVNAATLRDGLDRLRNLCPNASICFLDAYAHSDIRLAQYVDPYIKYYFKKALFRDERNYTHPFRGDTNLTEFYGDLYGIDAEPVDWRVPQSILPKLKLWPNFFTAPQFISAFAKPNPNRPSERLIDVHARLGIKGSHWYKRMREASVSAVKSIPDLVAVTAPDVSWTKYMQELKQSKVCFSPFGYGELCWRDIEAFLSGAILLKPDMSHLVTQPHLYEPWETYVPIRWDFQDLEEVLLRILRDASFRTYIADTAYRRVHDYVVDSRFLEDIGFLFR